MSEKKRGIGIVGCRFGAIATRSLVKRPDAPFRVAAVCDLNQALAEKLGAEVGAEPATDLDALLSDPEISAIGLFTGPSGRAELIRKVIRAGKHVMTTKPFELDARAAREVLEEAREHGRVVCLNSPTPQLAPDLAIILRWRREFNLGAPAYFQSSVHATYREKADGSWCDDFLRCPAAPILRLGIYAINDLLTLLGEVAEVKLLESRLFTARPTADNAILSLRFQNGCLGSVTASFCVDDGDYFRNSLQLSFERGTIHRNTGPQRSSAAYELNLIVHDNGRRIVRASELIPEDTNDYPWQFFANQIARGEPSSEEYCRRIVGGVRIVEMMAAEERKLLKAGSL